MGCVQAKPSPNSPPRGVDKLKLQSGYTPAPPKRSSSKDPNRGGPPRTRSVRGIGRNVASENGERDGGGGHRKREGVEAPRPPPPKVRPPEERAAEEEVELVDGWPKWLTDNIPREALAGLVPRSADSYDKLAKVGQGTYSNVYKARDRDTGKIVALKKVRFDTSESESVRFMAREIMVLQKLDHPNVIKLEGLATSRMQYSLYLVFDFMQSDLSRIISRPEGRLTEPQVKCYMHQLLSGLKHCHERGILHRDIKGSNLLIDKQGMLKIADFGLANYFNPNNKRPLTSRVVTLWYRAPELLLGTTDYGVGIDLWSAGCLLAEMFAGRPIMPGRTEVEQLHRIFKLCGSPPEDYWRKLRLSTSFRPPQPYKPNIAETFRDFPSSSLGLLIILLALDPSYRGSAASALQNEFFSINPLACDLSGLPVIYKEEDDESIRPRERRKRRSAKLKQLSRTQKEGPRNADQDIMKPKTGDYELPIEKAGTRATYSHELGTSITGSTSSSVQPPRYSVSIPFSLSPVKPPSFHESAGVQATRSHERISSITHRTSSGVQPQRSSVSTPLSKSPVKSPSFHDTAGLQTTHSHELGSSTTGSTSSGVQVGRYSVSSPPSPPPVKTSSYHGQRTEARPSATKNVQNLHSRHTSRASVNRSNNQRYGMEKRSVSTSGFGRFEGKQIPKR